MISMNSSSWMTKHKKTTEAESGSGSGSGSRHNARLLVDLSD